MAEPSHTHTGGTAQAHAHVSVQRYYTDSEEIAGFHAETGGDEPARLPRVRYQG